MHILIAPDLDYILATIYCDSVNILTILAFSVQGTLLCTHELKNVRKIGI